MKLCPTCKTEYASGEVFCPVDATRLTSPSQMPTADTSTSSQDPLVGQTLAGRYNVIRRIGEGGMGLVYEGLHNVIEKRVAIKVLRDDFSSRPDVVERFRQEAKSASRIGHQHIVDISDFGETPSGASYFVMEYLEGEDLANLLAREGTLPQERAAHIVLQCCRALGAAHAKGIVHRDMKPENVFLTKRDSDPDFVKIVDFGIAKMSDIETAGAPGRKLTKTGMIFGTPEYMSPEQAAGKPLDHRVDIYAVGVILYELVTGRVPFVGDSFMGILTQHMFEPPPPLRETNPNTRVSSALESVIWVALAKNPDERFQTMEEFATALTEATKGRAVETTKYGFAEPVKSGGTTKPNSPRPADSTAAVEGPKSRAGLFVGLGLAMLAIAGAGVFAATRNKQAPTAVRAAAVTPPPAIADAAVADPVPALATAPTVADAAAADVVDAGPTQLDIRVETLPDGADVLVEGSDLRCSPTPCTLALSAGQAVKLHAERGRSSGELELTPTTSMTVQIALAGRPAGRPSRPPSEGHSPRPPHGGDLKIPDIFR